MQERQVRMRISVGRAGCQGHKLVVHTKNCAIYQEFYKNTKNVVDFNHQKGEDNVHGSDTSVGRVLTGATADGSETEPADSGSGRHCLFDTTVIIL